jgi:hypothetical protein
LISAYVDNAGGFAEAEFVDRSPPGEDAVDRHRDDTRGDNGGRRGYIAVKSKFRGGHGGR